MSLTVAQAKVLRFIKSFLAGNGYPPTRAEIAVHFGWSSPNAAEEHLRALERKAALRITKGIARGIAIT